MQVRLPRSATAAVCAIAIVILWWLIPRRTEKLVTVDELESADVPRQIVWQPAEQFDAGPGGSSVDHSLIRPALADQGRTIYFTARDEAGRAKIYRSRKSQQGWERGEVVEAWQTDSDEIGPVLQPGGQTAYLYSNRPNGFGGFDIYVSHHRDGEWTRPQNLGPTINSPAHEYDPAIDSSGRQLFFASNRTPQMQQRMLETPSDQRSQDWRYSIRADGGQTTFDLYQATRDDPSQEWAPAHGVDELNRPKSNEGSPFIDPTGAFIYFASDRPFRSDEERNFDIYRARLRPLKIGPPRNLGLSINSPADEVEPNLTDGGFRLVFSRNQPQDESEATPASSGTYALFSSRSVEVETVRGWDTSHWSLLLRVMRGVFNAVILLALIACLAIAVWWFFRRVSARRATIPTFFLVALGVHVFLALSAFLVVFDPILLARVKSTFDAIAAFDSASGHQSHAAGEKSWERVGDLPSRQTQLAEVERQVTEATNVPVPNDRAVASIPVVFDRTAPAERVPEMLAAHAVVRPAAASTMTRNSRSQKLLQERMLSMERVVPVQPEQAAAPKTDIKLDRTSEPRLAGASPLKRRPSRISPGISREPIPIVEDAATPSTPVTPVDVQKQSAARESTPPANVVFEDIQQVDSTDTQRPQPRDLLVGRQEPDARVPFGVPSQFRPTPPPPEQSETPLRQDAEGDEVARLSNSRQVPDLNRDPGRAPSVADQSRMDDLPLPEPQPQPQPEAAVPSQTVPLERQAPAVAVDPEQLDIEVTAGTESPVQIPSTDVPDRNLVKSVEALGVGNQSTARLDRHQSGGPAVSEQTIAAGAEIVPETSDPVIEPAGVTIDLPRLAAAPRVPFRTSREVSGRFRPENSRLVIGSRSEERVEARLSPSPIRTQVSKRNAKAPLLYYAQDNIGLRAVLQLRQIPEDSKQDLIIAFGGKKETLPAIRRSISWLITQQHAEGRWSLREFRPVNGKMPDGQGSVNSDVAATGFALLPLLGNGHTHKTGRYQQQVALGLEWLLANQKDDGELTRGNEGNPRMYSHGIATIALCEAYAMTRDEALKEAAIKSLGFIVASQHQGSGGWRYQPGQSADTSVVGWQVMALKSGQMAGLEVPRETLAGVNRWLDRVGGTGPNLGRFGYVGHDFKIAMTAEGLLCLQYLDTTRDDPRLVAGAEQLLKHLPRSGGDSSYYQYYATQVMFHMQGRYWDQWNSAMSSTLLETQIKEGHMAGTWPPQDQWERSGGRIMSTALRALMLEVYFRHLPLYNVTLQDPSEP